MECFKCHDYGHSQRDCPWQIPAATWDEHLARIDAIVTLWADGVITIMDKRRAVASENQSYHGDACPPRLLKIT